MYTTHLHDDHCGSQSCTCCQPVDYVYYDKDTPENLMGCNGTDLFGCTSRVLYHSNAGPSLCQNRVKILNNKMGIKRDLNYEKTEDGCWTTCNDGRLTNMAHPYPMNLNAPPYTGEVTNKYSNKLKNIKTGYYDGYEAINSGQIQYYKSDFISSPFPHPMFASTANVDYFLFKTPMGGVEAEFQRTPLTCNDNGQMEGCSQWMKDSNRQRENLMASQMERFNKNNWSAINSF